MINNESSFYMDAIPLDAWLVENKEKSTVIWNHKWTLLLQQGDKEKLDHYLSSFCFSILDLSENDQVLLARTVFISTITDLLRLQREKQWLRSELLVRSYQKIAEIESWQNVTQFILNIPSLVVFLVEELLEQTPVHDPCPRIDEAIRLINEKITSRDLTVKWLAKQLNISPSHLSNLFRLKVGMNVSNYIAQRKVNEMAYDIVHTSLPLVVIREKYGFVSHSHFIQFFKKHKGKTPLKYRQELLATTEHKT